MLLTREEKKQLIDRFPSLELSYEIVLHNKVRADFYMVIPRGKKAFVWFTYWLDKNVCFVLILNDKNNICDVTSYPACFDSKLSLNTVIYGTLFSNINNSNNAITHFSCEQLFYYKGISTNNNTLIRNLNIFRDMFESDIKQVAYTTDFLILGMPIIKTNYEQALACINGLSYNIRGIAFYSINNNSTLGIYKINGAILPKAIFKVKPLLGADIYELYCVDKSQSELKLYGIAMIPSYKCSVMMNSLFRNIKENINLDLLEESDEEDEYENNDEDKYVDLNKSYNMRCTYNKKFKKWLPVEVVDDCKDITTF
jgi:hypothetical protein